MDDAQVAAAEAAKRRLELDGAAGVGRGDDVGRGSQDRARLALSELAGGARLDEVVDPGRAAAHPGVLDLDQLDAGDRAQDRARLGGDPLGVVQVAGVLVDDPGRLDRRPRGRRAELGEHLGHVAHASRRSGGPRRSRAGRRSPSSPSRTRRP